MKPEDFGLSSSNNVDNLKKFTVEIHVNGSTSFISFHVLSFELIPFLGILLRDNSDNLKVLVSNYGD